MPVKPWPESPETVSKTELVDSLEKAIRFAYDLKRKNWNSNIPWDSYDRSEDTESYDNAEEWLKRERFGGGGMKGEPDALRRILYLALDLGQIQGRRLEREGIALRMTKG